MELVPWIIRAILIIAGLIALVLTQRGKREGKFQEQYLQGILLIGTTALAIGIIMLVVSLITNLFRDYGIFLTAIGAIVLIIRIVIRKRWGKSGSIE